MAEWSIASDLKSDEPKGSGSSNLPLSVLREKGKNRREEHLPLLSCGEHSVTQDFFCALDDDLHLAGTRFDLVDTKVLETIEVDFVIQ